MSHVEMKKIAAKDLDALEAAAAALGGVLVRGQQTHAWWGTWVGDWRGARSAVAQGRDPKLFGQCDHAIQIAGKPGRNGSNGPWEVGVVQTDDGFALLYDNYGAAGAELERLFGKNLDTLSDRYAAQVAVNELSAQGYTAWIEMTPDGPDVIAESDVELF